VDHSGHRAPYAVTYAVVVVAVSSYSLLQSLVLPVLPTIQHALHTTHDNVTWVLTAYLLSASIATPIIGRIGDMYGKKKMLVGTMVLLGIGTAVAALATSLAVIIIGRVIQGVGGAVLPLAFGIIRDEAPKERIASGIAFAAALLAVGGGAGIVLAGPIVDALDWHWLFWIPCIVVGIGALAAFLFVPESPLRAPGQVAVVPAALLSGWLLAGILAVSEGQIWGWGSALTLGLLAASVVLAVVWVSAELRARTPLIDMRMMRLPSVWTTNLVALLFGAGMYGAIGFLPQFLQTPKSTGYGFGASVTASGFYLAPQTATMFFCGLLSSSLAARIGSRRVLLIGSLGGVPAFAMLAFAHHQPWEIYVATLVLGLSMGFVFASMSNIIVESVPADQVGVASGMNANIRTIGGSIGAAVMAVIITSTAHGGGLPKDSGYTNGFAFLMILAVLAAVACVLIPRPARDEPDTLAEAHAVEHGETALVAGASLADVE
jgi:EmrB/QacA subfamily drug resistance transporter